MNSISGFGRGLTCLTIFGIKKAGLSFGLRWWAGFVCVCVWYFIKGPVGIHSTKAQGLKL